MPSSDGPPPLPPPSGEPPTLPGSVPDISDELIPRQISGNSTDSLGSFGESSSPSGELPAPKRSNDPAQDSQISKLEDFQKETSNKEDFEVRKPGWRPLGWELGDAWSIQPHEEPHIECHPKNRKTSWCAAGGLGAPDLPPTRVSNDDLQEAALRGDLGLVRRLILCGASVNAPMQPESMDEFMTLLHLLCSKPEMPNGTRIVNEVIRAAADVDARSSSGLTPLILACRHKHIGAVELLMDYQAKTDPVCDEGRNAMCYAVLRDLDIAASDRLCCELVTLLFNVRADLDAGGTTPPIVEAVKQLNGSAVSLLVGFGAQPLGLSEAIAAAPLKLIQTLTNAEANPFVKDLTGKTPMDLALNRGDHEIMDLLRDFIADLQRRHHPHLQTPLEPGYDDIGIFDPDDNGGQWVPSSDSSYAGRRNTFRQSVRSPMMGRHVITRGKSVYDALPQAELTQLQGAWKIVRSLCRKLTKHRHFQIVMGVMLVFALFIVDLWVICNISASVVLDILLVIVFSVFLFEFMIQIIGFWRVYVFSFYFWMDFCGMISVMLDISVIRETMTIFQGDDGAKGGSSDGVVMRAARMAKLGARAGRFTKLVKFLRFLPGIHHTEAGSGTAKVITQALNTELAWKVSCLIIMVVIFLPMFDIVTYPTHDFSLEAWAQQLQDSVVNHPEEMEELVSDLDQFYSGKDYFPFEAACVFANNTVVHYSFSRPSPDNIASIVEVSSSDKRVTVKFDFGGELRKECTYRIGLVISIMIVLMAASLYITNAVTAIALLPLEDLFRKVQGTAEKIFSSLVSVGGQSAKDGQAQKTDEDDDDERDPETAIYGETKLLEQVITKISKVSALLMKKHPLDAEHLAGMDEADRAVLQGYQVVPAVPEMLSAEDKIREEDQSDAGIDEILNVYLEGVDLTIDALVDWDFNPFDLHERQKHAVCLTFLLYHRSSCPNDHISNVDLQRNYDNFITTCSVSYGSHKDVPYTNWNHAVDVCFTLFNIMKITRMSRYLGAVDRFGLLVAGMAHDIGHPGRNNGFLVSTGHEIAVRYNDSSPLENMHVATLFEMSKLPDHDIFAGMSRMQYQDVRYLCIQAILYTDCHKHFSLVKEIQVAYESKAELCDAAEWDYATEDEEEFNFPGSEIVDYYKTVEIQSLLKSSLLHFCDISNPLKPWKLAQMWADQVCEEFFRQGDAMMELGMPVQKLHDRGNANKPYSQIGFIEFFCGPMVLALNSLLPPLDFCVRQLTSNAEEWVEKWSSETIPTPDDDEQARVLERVAKMATKNRMTSFTPIGQTAQMLSVVSTNTRSTTDVTQRASFGLMS